jgi:hypothetical protein
LRDANLEAHESASARRSATELDPEPARPKAVAQADARDLVTLREPVARVEIARFVDVFFDAWRRESGDDLASLVGRDADVGPIEGRERGREAIVENWRERLKAHPHEFARLDGEVAPERIEQRGYVEDWARFGSSLPTTRMREGDVGVCVPIEGPSAGPDGLFRRYVVMILREEGEAFRIVAYGETDERPLP